MVHVNLAKEYQYLQLCIEIPELRVICYPGVAGETPRQDGIIGEELLRVLHKPASKPNKTSVHLQAEVQPAPSEPNEQIPSEVQHYQHRDPQRSPCLTKVIH